MSILLKLKHWQLFALTWGVPIVIQIFTFSNPALIMKLFPVLMIFFLLGTYGWVWAISTGLNNRLPEGIKINSKKFKILFSIPVIYILAIILVMGIAMNGGSSLFSSFNPGLIAIVIPIHIGSIVIAIWGMTFAAKTLKSIEIGRIATFSDYAGEFFLIWFSIIGYWILQPRINKLIENSDLLTNAKKS